MILIFRTHLQYLYKSTHEDQDFHPVKWSPTIWLDKKDKIIDKISRYKTEIFKVIYLLF